MKCVNCNQALAPQYRYCPVCSQTANVQRITLAEVSHQAVHYFHADKSIFSLVRDLATKSGTVAREYVMGMRKKYYSPLNFFLMVAAVYLLAMNLEQSPASQALRERPALAELAEGEDLAKLERFYQRQEVAVKFMQKRSNIIAMVTLPVSALIFFLFYRKREFNYTEHLVASMYMAGFSTLVYTVLILLNILVNAPVGVLAATYFLFQILYYAWFYFRFMDGTGKLRATVAAACGALAPGAVGAILILLYTFDFI